MAESDKPVVLIVDDEPQVCDILAESFADKPWQVETAHSGTEAMALCRQRTVDVLVLDKNLPDMSGVKLFWHLRTEGHPVACIMITGYGSAESALEMLNLGASAYFEKPFGDVFVIAARVEEILAERHRRRRRAARRARRRGAATDRPPTSQPVKPVRRPRLTVVAASSAPATRHALEESLLEEDVRMVASRRALEVELVEPVDLIVLDAELAAGSVPALVEWVRERAGETAIVVIAEYPGLELVKELIDLGVDVLIEKVPLDTGTFRSATADLLRHVRDERARSG